MRLSVVSQSLLHNLSHVCLSQWSHIAVLCQVGRNAGQEVGHRSAVVRATGKCCRQRSATTDSRAPGQLVEHGVVEATSQSIVSLQTLRKTDLGGRSVRTCQNGVNDARVLPRLVELRKTLLCVASRKAHHFNGRLQCLLALLESSLDSRLAPLGSS